jgi:hypothetical protein
MPRVGFEPTIPVFERTKTVHTLDRATTVIGKPVAQLAKIIRYFHETEDRLCGLVATDPEAPGSIPGATIFSEK